MVGSFIRTLLLVEEPLLKIAKKQIGTDFDPKEGRGRIITPLSPLLQRHP